MAIVSLLFFIIAQAAPIRTEQIISFKTTKLAGDGFKLTLEFSGPFKYTVHQDDKFSSFVIDIHRVKLAPEITQRLLAQMALRNLSMEQGADQIMLKLNVNDRAKFNHLAMLKPYRLVVDILNTTHKLAPVIDYSAANDNDYNEQLRHKSHVLAPVVSIAQPKKSRSESRADSSHSKKSTYYESTRAGSEYKSIAASKSYDDLHAELTRKLSAAVALEVDEVAANNSNISTPIAKPVMSVTDSSRNKATDVVVVIDPGHGGRDPGAVGASGTLEKDVVLAVAKYLQTALNNTRGFKAVLTRHGDYYLHLRQRLRLAREAKADMFISIHADACEFKTPSGASVYALSQRGATSEAARWLAKKENESELGKVMANKDQILRSVLLDLAQTASINTSLNIGYALLKQLNSMTHLHRKEVEQAGFVVLKSPDIASLLVETGFISEATEELKLRDSAYQQKLATVLAAGIKQHFSQRS